MTKVEYREAAEQCAACARTAVSEQARMVWRSIERYWRARGEETINPAAADDALRRTSSH